VAGEMAVEFCRRNRLVTVGAVHWLVLIQRILEENAPRWQQ
jgi:hypothetical protein